MMVEVLRFLGSPVWWPAYAMLVALGIIAVIGLRH